MTQQYPTPHLYWLRLWIWRAMDMEVDLAALPRVAESELFVRVDHLPLHDAVHALLVAGACAEEGWLAYSSSPSLQGACETGICREGEVE